MDVQINVFRNYIKFFCISCDVVIAAEFVCNFSRSSLHYVT